MSKQNPFLLTALVAVALPVVNVSAGLIASDEFTNPEGNTQLAGDTGGTGFSGGWVTSVGSTGAASSVDSTISAPSNYPFARAGGEAFLDNLVGTGTASSVTITRTLTTPINFDVDGTHYFSVLGRRNDASNGNGSEALYFLEGRNAASARVFGLGGNSTEQIVLTSGVNSAGLTPAYAIGTDYMIIGKVIAKATGNDEIFMELVPSSSALPTSEPAVYTYSFAAPATGSVTTLGASSPSGVDELRIDSIRYGSTFADVSAVPEPASVGLIVGGAVIAMRRRRR